jgi:hypothetical protein
MKRVLYASVIALGCTIAVAAQGGAADQEKDKAGKTGKEDGKSVTLTGCVAESGGHFMLNNATGEGTSPASYALSGGTLKPHVGHKVEVTGALKPAPTATSGKDAGKKDTMAKGDAKKDDMSSAGTVAVKDVKMVSATCS